MTSHIKLRFVSSCNNAYPHHSCELTEMYLCQIVPGLHRSWLSCSRWIEKPETQTSPLRTWSLLCILHRLRNRTNQNHQIITDRAASTFPPSLMSYLLWMSCRASSLDRVIFCCRQDDGRRDWLCFTRRWEQRTCESGKTSVSKQLQFLPPPALEKQSSLLHFWWANTGSL